MLLNLYPEERKKRKKEKNSPDTQLCSHFLALLYYCTREIKCHHWGSFERCNVASSLRGVYPQIGSHFTLYTNISAHCAGKEGLAGFLTDVQGHYLQRLCLETSKAIFFKDATS